MPEAPVPEDAPMRAFIYDRNSRVINGRLTSTEDQRTENRRLCERNGWVITGEFCDAGRSASRYARLAREDYERMLKGIREGGCNVLVVWEASRVSRSVDTFVELRKLLEQKNVLLCYNGRIHDMANRSDRFMTLLDAARAEDEADAIRERVLRTTRLNAERGRPHGRLPYGYKREYDPRTGELLRQVVDEEKAEVVREIARLVAGGKSLSSIQRYLNERAIPAPAGKEWTLTTLRNLVLRPTNIGKRQHQGQVVGEARWEAILDEETYFTCFKLLNDPSRLVSRDRDLRHWLAGVPVCGRCLMLLAPVDQPMRSLHTKGGWFIYVCRTCYRLSVRTAQLEDYVAAAVLARIESPGFAAALAPDVSHDAVRGALAQAEALEAQLAEARRLAVTFTPQGRLALSAASLAALEAHLVPQIEAARSRALDATVPAVLRRTAGPQARERWEGLDLAQRRALVRAVARVVVFPVGRGYRGVGRERVTITWLL